MLRIRPAVPADRSWIEQVVRERWNGPVVTSHGNTHNALNLPALIAEWDGTPCGLATYRVDGAACEVVTLDALRPGQGVGTALLDAVAHAARDAGCARLWLITTNDNLDALRFYQRRGFTLIAVHRDVVTQARQLKPSIPQMGNYGIPIRDEVELERLL